MGLVANGIYGVRTFNNATLLGRLPSNRKTFATNVLTWENKGDAAARERVSYPSGRYKTAFYMPLKEGGIACTITSTSSLTASISAVANMTASLSGAGSIVPPTLFGAKSMEVTITGGGSIITAEIGAIANMKCTIRIGANPSADDIAQAIWGSVATMFNQDGTMGQKLNGAGSAGDPWSDERALTVGKFLGLK